MTRYFEAMRVALERHGGTVEKFIGDAVMAVFGLPVRHEDDALRAHPRGRSRCRRRCRRSMTSSARPGASSCTTTSGSTPARSSPATPAPGQRLVTGDAVNTAARLEQAAGAGEIVLGELTYRLARDEIEVEAIPPLTLKGKAEPVAAFRLIAVRGPNARSGPRSRPRSSAARRRWSRLETALAGGRGQPVLRAADGRRRGGRRQVPADPRVRDPRLGQGAQPGPARPLPALRRRHHVLADRRDRPEAAGINDEDPLRGRARQDRPTRSRRGRRPDDPIAVADRVAAAIGLSTAQFPGPELFWGIRRLLEAIASRRPLVAIVDDIHVAAPTFLELLDHLLETVHGAPDPDPRLGPPRAARARAPSGPRRHEATQIMLEPLSADEADSDRRRAARRARRVRARRASWRPPRATRCTSSRSPRCSSRPARSARDGDGWVAMTSSEDLHIPPTVQALVAARLDALGPDERVVIDPASVIGLGFAVEAVVHLVPDEAVRSGPGAPRDADRQAARAPDRRRGGLLPVRARGHQGCGLPQPAQARLAPISTSASSTGRSRSTASAAASSSSRRSSATTWNRRTATASSSDRSMRGASPSAVARPDKLALGRPAGIRPG